MGVQSGFDPARSWPEFRAVFLDGAHVENRAAERPVRALGQASACGQRDGGCAWQNERLVSSERCGTLCRPWSCSWRVTRIRPARCRSCCGCRWTAGWCSARAGRGLGPARCTATRSAPISGRRSRRSSSGWRCVCALGVGRRSTSSVIAGESSARRSFSPALVGGRSCSGRRREHASNRVPMYASRLRVPRGSRRWRSSSTRTSAIPFGSLPSR